jgi:hypothetical protein
MYFRARYYDPNTGEFTSRDPLEYVDGMSQYRGFQDLPLVGVDDLGDLADEDHGGGSGHVEFDTCAIAKARCKELRNRWNDAGHGCLVKFMDLFLGKSHGHTRDNPADLTTLCPDMQEKLISDSILISGLRAKMKTVPCDGKTHSVNWIKSNQLEIEYLPLSQCANVPLPLTGDPIECTPEQRQLAGTLRFQVKGTISTNSWRETYGSGCSKQYRSCCTRKGNFTYTVKDPFSFGRNWFRECGGFGTNTYAPYYKACGFLQESCGHDPPWWEMSGSLQESFTSCRTAFTDR